MSWLVPYLATQAVQLAQAVLREDDKFVIARAVQLAAEIVGTNLTNGEVERTDEPQPPKKEVG